MARWLLKSDPDTYGADHLEKDRTTNWSGVRNPTARRNLQAMQKGDEALFYHSGDDKAVVGVVEVVQPAYPDEDEGWVQVDVKWKRRLKKPVTLKDIKADPVASKMDIVRQSRLSVSLVRDEEWDAVLALSAR